MDHQVGSSAMNLVRSKTAGGPGCQSWPLYWKLASMLFSWLLVTWSADALVEFPMAAVRWIGPECTLGPPEWLLVVWNAHGFMMALVDNSNRNKMDFNEWLIWQSLRNPWVVNSILYMGIHRWLCQSAPWCPFYGHCPQTHEPYHWNYMNANKKWHELKKTHGKPKGFGKTTHGYVKPQRLMENNTVKTCWNLTSSNAFFHSQCVLPKSGNDLATVRLLQPWYSLGLAKPRWAMEWHWL